MNKLIRYFLQGLLLLSPVAITIYAIVVTFQFTDGLLRWALGSICQSVS
jgi:uncharacterized membrane protein